MAPNAPKRSVVTVTSVAATTIGVESLRAVMSSIRLRIEPEPLVAKRRLRPDVGVLDAEDSPLLEAETLDLAALVFVENRVVRPVGDHRAHPLLGAGSESPSFFIAGEPEIHRQGIVEDEILLDGQIRQSAFSLIVLVENFHR